MTLTAKGINLLEPKEKSYKVSDGHGLNLIVFPNGGKYWRLRYRYDGKEKTLSIGVFPQVSIEEARKKRSWAKKLLADGLDPSLIKREIKTKLKMEMVVRRNNLISIEKLIERIKNPNITMSQLLKIQEILFMYEE